MKEAPKKNFRQIRYEVKKTQILESAARVFSIKGFEKATMEEIAEELYMTKGSLYYYLKSKEDMLFQCHLKALEMANEVLDSALESDIPPELKLHKAIVGHVEVLTEEFVVGTLRQQELLLPKRMRLKVVAQRDKFEKRFLRILEEGIEAGVFSGNDVKMKSYFILGAVNWIPRWYSPSGRRSAKHIGEAIADLAVKLMKT
jgi:AcrR family transcriptional regulator